MPLTSIGDALFTKTQQRVLGLLYGTPDKSFFTNEIFRRTDIGRGTVLRELEKLVAAELITVIDTGNQRHYQANTSNSIYTELINIVRKTFGIADVIRSALEPVSKQLELAFVYGSLAKNTEDKKSDVDLMLVGFDLNYGDVMELLLPLEESLHRTINPTVYSKADFDKKLEQGNSFLERVMEQPKLMIKGIINDTGESGKNKGASI